MIVLIVEDEPLVALEIEHAVERTGHRVFATVPSYAHARLADGHTGARVAGYLDGLGIYCIAITGNFEIFDDCDHVRACLAKPFSDRNIESTLIPAEMAVASGRGRGGGGQAPQQNGI